MQQPKRYVECLNHTFISFISELTICIAYQDQKPSDVLHVMSSKVSAEAFMKVLEKNLYPELDELSSAAQLYIVEHLELAQQDLQTAELLSHLQYDVHAKSLNTQVKVLIKDAKKNGTSDSEQWEEHGMYLVFQSA